MVDGLIVYVVLKAHVRSGRQKTFPMIQSKMTLAYLVISADFMFQAEKIHKARYLGGFVRNYFKA